MNYQTYKAQKAQGTVVAGIDKSAALRLIDYLPKRYQYAHMFWSWVWMLSIPLFIILAFFTFGIGLLGLFIVTPLIFKSTKKSAAESVLEHAENDPAFFDKLVEGNLLTFRQSNR